VLSLLAVSVIWGLVGLLIWRDRAETLRATGLLTESLTRTVAQRLDGALRGVDLMLQDVVTRAGAKDGDEAALVAFMRNRSAAFPEVRNLFLITADGTVTATTIPELKGQSLAHRPYFNAAKTASRAALMLNEPSFSPVTGRMGVVAFRPIVSALGSFEGVIAAAVNPEFFREALSGAMSEEVDRSVIANLNGDVLARLPDEGADAKPSIRNGPLFSQYLPKARSGTFIATSAFDGRDRLASYVALERYPVVVSMGTTVETALHRWNFNVMVVASAGGGFSLLVLGIAVQLDRRGRAERAAEAALATSEENYRLLVENQDDLIHRYHPDTTLVFVNRAYADFYGSEINALIGRRWLDFVPEEQHDEIRSALSALTPAAPGRVDRRLSIRPDHPDRWIEWQTVALFDQDGLLTGYQTIGRDVTDATIAQQVIAEREELYSQIFHRNPAVKLLIDPSDGRIVDANEAASLFYGYPIGTLKTMPIAEINTLPPDRIKAEMAAVARHERPFLRFKHRLASGTIRDVEVYSTPIQVKGRDFLSSIVVDVTERNRFEAELAAKTADLVRSNTELEQFAYVASHDLRQPLRMVSSYVALLGRRLAGKLGSEEQEFMDFAVAGVKRMDSLILALLDYSRVGRGGEMPHAVDLSEAVREAAANLGIGAGEDEVTLVIKDGLPTIDAVPGEMIRLFQNLLGNAVKYRHPDRAPRIEVGCRHDDGEWVVVVDDNGIGIEPDYFERVFKMFQRLNVTPEVEGTGIGLSICRKIVVSHGGRNWVESTPGLGSRFLIGFPDRRGA
jgi:PAS domain S-box-containing protein